MRRSSLWMYFWDVLCWVLVIFPLLSGGVWLRRPGLALELSQLSVPVLILGVLAAVLVRLGEPLAQASSVRTARALWNRWRDEVSTRPVRAIAVLVFLETALLAAVSIHRHRNFGSGASDMGIFAGAIWNLTHGNGYISSVKDGINLFQDHQSPIFWSLAPFFRLWPRVEVLLLAQALSIALGGAAVFRLAMQYAPRGHWSISALPILFFCYLPLRNTNGFDFHPEVMMLPLYLWAIVGLQETSTRSRILGGLAFLLALLCKESAGPIGVGIGIAWLLGASPVQARAFTRKAALGAILLGIAQFVIDTTVVPSWFGTPYAYSSNYEEFGPGLKSLALAPFLRPEVFWGRILGLSRLKLLFQMLAPLAILSFGGWRALVATLPAFGMLFLDRGDHRVTTQLHYAIEPSIGIFWAAALGGAKRPGTPRLAIALVVVTLLFFGRSELYRFRQHPSSESLAWLREQSLPCLSQAPTAASGALVPHLANRPWIHHLPRLDMPGGETVRCVVRFPGVNNWPLTSSQIPELDAKIARDFHKTYGCGEFEVFEKNSPGESCLSCSPACPGS